MANDNTLGAPTEGLGQTVTFVAGGRQGVPQISPVARGELRVGSQGGGAQMTARALQVPEGKPDPTFSVLAKLGGELLKPHIEAERNASFFRGVQQAATNQAITEIVDEQPWYSKIFGSTSLVDGARAYTASKAATGAITSMEENIGELRKMSDNDFSNHVGAVMSSLKTGDATTDMMVTQQFTSAVPAFMKARTKSHMRYQQEVFSEKAGANQDQAFDNLQVVMNNQRNGDGTRTDEEAMSAIALVDQALAKPTTVDQGEWDKIANDRIVGAVQRGNFTLFDHIERNGTLAAMPAQAQYNVYRARSAASAKAQEALPVEFLMELAQFEELAVTDGTKQEQILAKRDELQSKYTKYTGDHSPLISGRKLVQELSQRSAHEKRLQEELLRKAAKDGNAGLEAAIKDKVVTDMFLATSPGSASPMASLVNLTAEEKRGVFGKAAALPIPNRIAYLAKQFRGGIKDDSFETELQTMGNHALQTKDPVLFANVYSQFVVPMIKHGGDMGMGMAMAYVGAGPLRDAMMRMHDIAPIDKTIAPEHADRYYNYATAPSGKPLGKEDKSARAETIRDAVANGWFRRTYSAAWRSVGGDTFPTENAEQVTGWLNETMPKDGDPLLAPEIALESNPRVSVVGGYGWTKREVDTSLASYLKKQPKVSEDDVFDTNYNRATREYLDVHKDRLRIESKFSVMQQADINGVPQLFIMGLDSAGQTVFHNFSADDIITTWRGRKERMAAEDAELVKQAKARAVKGQ